MGKKRQNQTSVSGFFNKIPKISFNENEAKPSTSKQMISPNLATKTSPIKTIENFEILGELPANLLPDIGENPHQPNISFKKTLYGGKIRSFNYKWFSEFHWLHYNEAQDKVYCFN